MGQLTRQWKFEKFISQKIQTNDLERVEATTGDNVVLSTTATVNWPAVPPAGGLRPLDSGPAMAPPPRPRPPLEDA